MANPLDLLKLAERVEQASGPDRELDALIYCAVKNLKFVKLSALGIHHEPVQDSVGGFYSVMLTETPYTSSIDAALTLTKLRDLHLSRRSNPDMGGRDWLVSYQSPTTRIAARSWALGICAASLRALAGEKRP